MKKFDNASDGFRGFERKRGRMGGLHIIWEGVCGVEIIHDPAAHGGGRTHRSVGTLAHDAATNVIE